MNQNRISCDSLFEAFDRMTLIRAFEDEFRQQTLAGKSRGYNHVYAGQEACAVAVALHLNGDDVVMSTHRAQGHYISKCGDVERLAAEMLGRADGCCGGYSGSMHIAALDKGVHGGNGIIGASAPHAVGAALAFKLRGERRVAVSYSGDGGTSQGGFLESLNMASVLRLPVVFVVEDNGYAESTASSWAIGGYDLVRRAAGFGIPATKVEAIDFPDIYHAAGAAVAAARDGEGPQLLHVIVPLFYGHYVGDPELYRAKGEARRERKEKDCIKRLKALLVDEYDVSEDEVDARKAESDARVMAAFAAAGAAGAPDPARLYDHVYAPVAAGLEAVR